MAAKQKLLLGAHISTSGGLHKALERGASIGCTTMQIFTKSNRQWNAKKLTSDEIEDFKKAVKAHDIDPIVVHCTYLINIGSPNEETEKKSLAALITELQRCQELGLKYLVLHPGSHLNTDEDACLARIARNVDAALEAAPGETMILLETMAGQGSSTCYKFEHIARIRALSHHKNRVGVCLDTCHVFVAGYDMRTKKGYEQMWQKFDDTIGLDHLKALHVNDSKKDLDSHVDRHEDLGKGLIGLEGFRLLFNDERFFSVPKIIETPKADLPDDLRNMQTAVSLLSKETREKLEVCVVE
jgi:deoxyribonuclease-4